MKSLNKMNFVSFRATINDCHSFNLEQRYPTFRQFHQFRPTYLRTEFTRQQL